MELDVQLVWVDLFQATFKVPYLERTYLGLLGAPTSVCDRIWIIFQASPEKFRRRRRHVFWVLYFLKTYSTSDVLHSTFHVNEKTYRTWLWKGLEFLYTEMDEVYFSP